MIRERALIFGQCLVLLKEGKRGCEAEVNEVFVHGTAELHLGHFKIWLIMFMLILKKCNYQLPVVLVASKVLGFSVLSGLWSARYYQSMCIWSALVCRLSFLEIGTCASYAWCCNENQAGVNVEWEWCITGLLKVQERTLLPLLYDVHSQKGHLLCNITVTQLSAPTHLASAQPIFRAKFAFLFWSSFIFHVWALVGRGVSAAPSP